MRASQLADRVDAWMAAMRIPAHVAGAVVRRGVIVFTLEAERTLPPDLAGDLAIALGRPVTVNGLTVTVAGRN